MVDSKILRRVRVMLIGSFQRKTVRRLLSAMLVAWHEVAVHKTVETRSRSQLRASLKAQEELTASAEEQRRRSSRDGAATALRSRCLGVRSTAWYRSPFS